MQVGLLKRRAGRVAAGVVAEVVDTPSGLGHHNKMFTTAEGGHPKMAHDTNKERDMPQIIVAADRGPGFGEGAVTFRERVNVADFESEHFAAQLVERLGWAVEDADQVERRRAAPADGADRVSSRRDEHDEHDEHDEPADGSGQVERRREERIAVHAPA
jgi:hypothetical protein